MTILSFTKTQQSNTNLTRAMNLNVSNLISWRKSFNIY